MSLKRLDLKDTIAAEFTLDEYQAKMGEDDEIIVIAMKSKYQDQAADLVNFLEKGYDWILDADVSTGELEDGSYLVFIECLRRPSVPHKIIRMLNDIENLTGIPAKDYGFKYQKDTKFTPLTVEALTARVPLEPKRYRKLNKTKDDVDLENMQMQAGLSPKTEPVTDPELKHFVNLSKTK